MRHVAGFNNDRLGSRLEQFLSVDPGIELGLGLDASAMSLALRMKDANTMSTSCSTENLPR